MMRPAGNCRALRFKIAEVNAMDMNKLIAEYEADLVPLRRRIEQLKLQESACHAVGEHLRAYKLSQKRMQYQRAERDMLYAIAQMSGTK